MMIHSAGSKQKKEHHASFTTTAAAAAGWSQVTCRCPAPASAHRILLLQRQRERALCEVDRPRKPGRLVHRLLRSTQQEQAASDTPQHKSKRATRDGKARRPTEEEMPRLHARLVLALRVAVRDDPRPGLHVEHPLAPRLPLAVPVAVVVHRVLLRRGHHHRAQGERHVHVPGEAHEADAAPVRPPARRLQAVDDLHRADLRRAAHRPRGEGRLQRVPGRERREQLPCAQGRGKCIISGAVRRLRRASEGALF